MRNMDLTPLYRASVGFDRIADLMDRALSGRKDAWLRVSLFSPEIGHRAPSFVGRPKVMTVVSPPPPPLAVSVRVKAMAYEREAPHLKHVATMGLTRARRAARPSTRGAGAGRHGSVRKHRHTRGAACAGSRRAGCG